MALLAAAGLVLVLALGFAPAAQATTFTADGSLVSTDPAGGPKGIAIGDLDGDGIPDFATANGTADGSASLLRNDGSANFNPLSCLPPVCTDGTLGSAGTNVTAVAIADLNGDGRRDVVVANAPTDASLGTLTVYTANADAATNPNGSYTKSVLSNALVGGFPSSLAIGDLNGDGKLDIAIGNGGTAHVTILLRTGATGAGTTATDADYTSTTPPTGLASPAFAPAVAIADFDGDGRSDLVLTDSRAAGGRKVVVMYQDASGTSFTNVNVTTTTVGAGPTTVAVGDLNGDGRPDIAAASLNGNRITTLLKDPTGNTFTQGTALTPASFNPGAIAIGDLDGDGRGDVVVAKTTVPVGITVYLKDATGATYTPTALEVPAGPNGLLGIADLAGAGKLDILTSASSASSVAVLVNTTPQGTTTALGAAPSSPSPSGTSVTFTATVAKVVSGLRGSVAPTGSVTFTVDGTPQSPVSLSGAGTASVSTASLGVGPHTIDAAYSGDANYAASTKSTSYTVSAAPPSVVTGAASSVSTTGASLAGTINPNGTPASYTFEYGTSTGFGSITTVSSAGSGSAAVPVSATLSGLTPGTTYFYRLVGASSTSEAFGSVATFRTTGGAPPPVVVTGAASSVSNTGATLAGTVNPNGVAASYTFEYGTSTNFGSITTVSSAGSGSGAAPVSATLSGLSPGTTYFYRLVASSASGDSIGAVAAFRTTGGAAPPAVVTGAASSVTPTGASLAGTINPNGVAASYTFEYGTSTNFGSITTVSSAGSGSAATPVSATLSGLSPGTRYYYRLVGASVAGDTMGAIAVFDTPPAT